jgi:hypothetical protein
MKLFLFNDYKVMNLFVIVDTRRFCDLFSPEKDSSRCKIWERKSNPHCDDYLSGILKYVPLDFNIRILTRNVPKLVCIPLLQKV